MTRSGSWRAAVRSRTGDRSRPAGSGPETIVLGGGLMSNRAFAARALGALGDDSVVAGGLYLLATRHQPAIDSQEAAT